MENETLLIDLITILGEENEKERERKLLFTAPKEQREKVEWEREK